VEIKDVTFLRSALEPTSRPKDWLPQIAVAGRSNVGKSSLLNWLCRRQIARVAKAPGKTRTLNFYLVNRAFLLVDLPGYGYAKVHSRLRQQWGAEVARYLADEQRLAGVVSLIDIRHGPSPLDLELQELLLESGRERLVVLTKADKVNRSHRANMRREVQVAFGVPTPPPVVSVRSGEGRRELLDGIEGLLDRWREQQRGE
jgi:GTP-binding protein